MKYTNSAKKALSLANKCSTRLGHRYIGTEHLLYGLMKELNGVAAMVLQDLGVDDGKLLELIEQLIAPDQEIVVLEKDGFTPSTMNVLEQAKEEAERFQSMEIGTEHLLMAILKEKECAAVRLLNTMGVAPQKIYVDLLVAMGKDLEDYKEEIVKAIKMVQSNSFTKKLKNMKIPFEGGKTAEKILEKIVQVVENKINLQKGFYDIYFKTDIEK